MAKYYKYDSEKEKKFQRIEELLSELGITLEWSNDITITIDGEPLTVRSSEGSGWATGGCLPRQTDDEKLYIRDGVTI